MFFFPLDPESRLWVGGIPQGATQNMLRDEFSKVGEAGKVHGLALADGDGCRPMF